MYSSSENTFSTGALSENHNSLSEGSWFLLDLVYTLIAVHDRAGLQMNPNDYDDGDQQVMSRPSATANVSGRVAGALPPVVNGVAPNAELRLDMDGEVTVPVEQRELRGGKGVGSTPGVVNPLRQDPEMSRTPRSAREFLQIPMSQNDEVRQSDPPSSSGLGTRLMEGRPEQPPVSDRHTRAGDSVEYASVASTVTRREQQRAPQEFPTSQGGRLFDVHAIEQLQRLHASAPQLLGASQTMGNPRPPSTSSSDIQAEVRRQLGEMVAGYEEEARRLRSQVEAWSQKTMSCVYIVRLRMYRVGV